MVNFLAIDLGTTKISAALLTNGKAQAIELGNGTEMPSAIYINNDIIRFGKDAMKLGKTDPENLYEGLKCLIGRSFTTSEFRELKKQVPYPIQRDKNGRCILMVRQNSKRVPKSPTDLVAMLIRHIVDIARKRGYKFDGIVLGYPPSFKEPQIREICAAAALANVDHVDLVSEPSAACLFSGISPLLNKGNTLIIDCGGGTTDFSVVNTDNGEFEVVYTYGIPELGGVDFTTAIVNRVLEDLRDRQVEPSLMSEREKRELREVAEDFKTGISSGEKTKDLEFSVNRKEVSVYFTEMGVKVACHGLLRECAKALNHVLDDMKTKNITIDRVVLAGGGLLLPCLEDKLCGILKNKNTVRSRPDAVVCGIVYAARRVADKHVPGDMCLLSSLDPDTPVPETPVPETPVPDENGFPVLSPDLCFSRYSVHMQESPAADDEETSDAALCRSQYPISQQAAPDEVMLNKNNFSIKEKRAYNIYVKQLPINEKDLHEIMSKDKPLPFTAEHFTLVINTPNIRVILYEGLKPESKKCTAIRQITLKCDEKHEKMIEEKKELKRRKYPRMDLYVTADRKGLLSFVAKWQDNNEELEIISDCPVPSNYRQLSQKHLNAPAEQNESPVPNPQPGNAANSVAVGRRPQGGERVLPTPILDSFSMPSPSLPIDLPDVPTWNAALPRGKEDREACLSSLVCSKPHFSHF